MEYEYKTHHTESIPITSTPTRRKKATESRTPRRGRAALQEDAPWTAARCQRLLRTISSRIQILRRLSENDFAEQFLRTPKAKRKRDVSVDPIEKLGSRLAALQTPSRGDDPEWFPSTTKKNGGRTYGARERGKKSQSTTHEKDEDNRHLGFRTPYIRRLLRADAMLSPESPADPYSTSGRLAQINRKAQQDAIQPKTHAERALKTLLDSFDSLLASTNPEVPERRRGVSSLKSMCLRKMPEYIDYEQRWAEEEEDDYVFDATETIYVTLENLRSGSTSALRELVRAHAVKMITDAMQERMWPLTSFDRLMDICTKHNAIREGNSLLRTWLHCSTGKIENPESCFIQHATKSRSTGFMYRTLAEDLDADRFNSCALSIPWTEMPTALARRSFFADAATFLRKFALVVCAAKTDDEKAISQRQINIETLRNLMSVVTAIALRTGFSQDSTGDGFNLMADQIHRLAFEVTQSALIIRAEATGNARRAFQVADCFLSSSLMTHVALGTFDQSSDRMGFSAVVDLSRQLDSKVGQSLHMKQGSIESTRAEFVCKVARYAAGWDIQVSEDDVVRQTTSGLLLAQSSVASGQAGILKALAIAIAASWAQSRGDNASYIFAEEVQRLALSDGPCSGSSPSSGSSNEINGYKWEEAIGEWVAATPMPYPADGQLSRDGSVCSRDSGIGMSESDTPSKKPIALPAEPRDQLQTQAIHKQDCALLPSTHQLSVEDRDELASSPCKLMSNVLIVDLMERDELASSPLKSKAASVRPAETSTSGQIQVTYMLPPTAETSATETDYACIPSLPQDRDELAMTPQVARKNSVKDKRSRTRNVQATPARMNLRSQRKTSRLQKTDGVRRGDSDDELAV